MKKLIALLLAVALFCGLCGCTSQGPINEEKYAVTVSMLSKSTGKQFDFENCMTYYPGSTPVINQIDGIKLSDVKYIWIESIPEFPYNILECCRNRYYAAYPEKRGSSCSLCEVHSNAENSECTLNLRIVDGEGITQEYVTIAFKFEE